MVEVDANRLLTGEHFFFAAFPIYGFRTISESLLAGILIYAARLIFLS